MREDLKKVLSGKTIQQHLPPSLYIVSWTNSREVEIFLCVVMVEVCLPPRPLISWIKAAWNCLVVQFNLHTSVQPQWMIFIIIMIMFAFSGFPITKQEFDCGCFVKKNCWGGFAETKNWNGVRL